MIRVAADLPHPASLFDGFFSQSNLRVKPLSRFAEGEIKPNHIQEGYQESKSETVAVQPPVSLVVPPGRAQVTKEGNLQTDVKVEPKHAPGLRDQQIVTVLEGIDRLIFTARGIESPAPDGVGSP